MLKGFKKAGIVDKNYINHLCFCLVIVLLDSRQHMKPNFKAHFTFYASGTGRHFFLGLVDLLAQGCLFSLKLL